jgi:hypothetical protein
MRAADAALQIKIPRNKTVLMQQLQLLVFRRHCWWCSGIIDAAKLSGFVAKMAVRYPLTRTVRGRAYDRTRGLAAMHFIAYPIANGLVAWWLLSDEGKGGLNDPATPDAHVAKNAMAADGHITFTDYVLHYAHKKSPRHLPDKKTGKDKIVLKNVSTWTWKLSDTALNETKASIERAAANFEYGTEGAHSGRPSGVLGILVCQRSRPLFSGVRNQVIDLHRHADSHWGRVKKKWQGQHSAQCLNDVNRAGELRPLKEIVAHHLPKMVRIAVYGDSPKTIGDLVRNK